jgi:hypothetical protein
VEGPYRAQWCPAARGFECNWDVTPIDFHGIAQVLFAD